MRIRRSFPIVLGVLLVAGAVALVVVLRKHAPPEAARLLPGADGFVYVDLKWMRRINLLGELPQVHHDPEYEQFIQATGFDAERDLEEAAVAIHYPAVATSGSKSNPDVRFSGVFVGHFQAEQLNAYLKKTANAVENYRSTEIYSIPLEDLTFRVAVLSVNSVAASNVADPQIIRGIIDRSRKLASPFGGPAVLRQYYKEVPLASLAWAVLRMKPAAESASVGPQTWSFLFSKPAVVVASVRYLGSVHLKASAFTGSEDDAAKLTEKVGAFLDLFRTAQNTAPPEGTDADVKALVSSLQVIQQKDRAVLTAIAPAGFVRKILAESPTALPAERPQPAAPVAAQPAPTGRKKHH
jgi:hypothetical protein